MAEQLINTDEKEVGDDLGQNVRDTFPEGDVFLDATDPEYLQQVTRLTEILFRHPYRTPTLDEYGLFHAKAAALRSADLSRKVGAVITTEDGEIMSSRMQQKSPKAGSGSLWERSVRIGREDHRDFVLG